MAGRTKQLGVREVSSDDWSTVEALFGERGACGGCWCMHWRMPKGADWEVEKGERNRRALRALVRAGAVRACLAYDGEQPVGWCCFGPRGDFPRLLRARSIATDAGDDDWAVLCFFVPSKQRGRGVASALLAAAVAAARRHGARWLEGYPVRLPESSAAEDARYPATFAFVGVPALFESAGFRRVSAEDAQRPVYRRTFRAARHA